MGVSLAMVTLAESGCVLPDPLSSALQADWPELSPISDMQEENHIVSFDIGGASAYVSHMRVPIPWSELEEACATSAMWPEAEASLRSHDMHLIIAVTGEQSALERARLLTQVIASAIAACPAANGVYWGDAGLVTPTVVFRAAAIELLPRGPAIPLWVSFNAGHNETGGSAGFTRGLNALGLVDIEATDAPESPSELYKRLESITDYLFENGLVIEDGDTVGESAREKIRVARAQSQFGSSSQVLRLEYEKVSKPFWKVW